MFKVSAPLCTHEEGCLEQREVPVGHSEIVVTEVRRLVLLLWDQTVQKHKPVVRGFSLKPTGDPRKLLTCSY